MTTIYDVFVSHNGHDKPIVERLCRALLEAGVRPWFDKWDLAPGDVWMREIEGVLAQVPAVLVCVGEHGWSAWHEAERLAAIDRATSGSGMVIPVLLPGAPQDVKLPMFLRDRQWTDLRPETAWEGEVARLAATIMGQAPRGTWIDEERARPYRGLQPFTEADAGWMFGREREEAKLLVALRDGQRFITVVGASGAGKSSLVRAGVVPTVRTGGIDGRHRWHALVMRPGPRPCHTLALRLLELRRTIEGTSTDIVGDGDKLKELGARLLTNEGRLSETVDLLLDREDRDAQLLLVVDQFEELFTADAARVARDDGYIEHEDELLLEGTKLDPEGTALLRNILHATNDGRGRVRVIVTVRADFMGECLSVPSLARRMERMHFALPPMGAEQLREAIRRPASRLGYDVEKALADVLVSATEDQPGRLPLLQHTLDLLWDVRDRRGRRLSYAAYVEHIGSLDESVAKRAEEVFAALVAESADNETTARQVFLRLVHLGEGTGDTRRQVPRSELRSNVTAVVLDRFVEARLLVTDTFRGGTGDQAVEIAHEALLGRWGRLRRWLNENREALRLRQEVNVAANHWKEHGRTPDDLWRGGRLSRASEMLLNGDVELAENEQEFLYASREAKLQQQRAIVRRQRRFLMGAVGFSGILILALAIALGQYLDAKRFGEEKNEEAKRADEEAENSRRERDAAYAATTAERSARASHMAGVPGEELEALELGVRAVGSINEEDWSSSSIVRGLHGSLSRARRIVTLQGHTMPIWALAWNNDGTRLAIAGGDGKVSLWSGATGDLLATLEGHKEVVLAVGWSADGTRLATASQDGTARLWNGTTGVTLAVLEGHTKSVIAMAWAADGARLATASQDGTARLWNGTTGEPLAILQHSRSVLDVAWTTDGTRLATASQDGTVGLWRGTSGEPLAILKGHTGPVLAIAWTTGGRRLATAGGDGTVRLWDGSSGKPLVTLKGHTNMIVDVAWTTDGTRLVTASHDQTARLWNGLTGEPLATLTGHRALLTSVAWTSDGTYLATGSSDGTAKLWNGLTGEPVATLTGHTSVVNGLAWRPDDSYLATASMDGTAKLWSVTTGEPLATLKSRTELVEAVAWSPDGSRLVTAQIDSTAKLWNAATGEIIASIDGHKESNLPQFGGLSVIAMAWAADGTRLATASRDGKAKLWKGTTGEPLATLHVPTEYVEAFAWTADATCLAIAGPDGTATLWKTTTGEPMGSLQGHTRPIRALAWVTDGSRLATADSDGTVKVWRSTGELLATHQGHTQQVEDLAWTADGTRLATASRDGTVRLWSGTGEPITTLEGHEKSGFRLAWTADGARLAAATADGTVRVWSGLRGEPLAVIKGHTQPVGALAWTADGAWLATASRDGTARLWSGTQGTPLATLQHTSSVLGLRWTADDAHLVTVSRDGTSRLWTGSTRGWLVRACEILEDSTGTFDLHEETKAVCVAVLSNAKVMASR